MHCETSFLVFIALESGSRLVLSSGSKAAWSSSCSAWASSMLRPSPVSQSLSGFILRTGIWEVKLTVMNQAQIRKICQNSQTLGNGFRVNERRPVANRRKREVSLLLSAISHFPGPVRDEPPAGCISEVVPWMNSDRKGCKATRLTSFLRRYESRSIQ